jgi:hypothetical protein
MDKCLKAENTDTGDESEHVREAAQYNVDETRIKAITAQIQDIKHLFGLHLQKDE